MSLPTVLRVTASDRSGISWLCAFTSRGWRCGRCQRGVLRGSKRGFVKRCRVCGARIRAGRWPVWMPYDSTPLPEYM